MVTALGVQGNRVAALGSERAGIGTGAQRHLVKRLRLLPPCHHHVVRARVQAGHSALRHLQTLCLQHRLQGLQKPTGVGQMPGSAKQHPALKQGAELGLEGLYRVAVQDVECDTQAVAQIQFRLGLRKGLGAGIKVQAFARAHVLRQISPVEHVVVTRLGAGQQLRQRLRRVHRARRRGVPQKARKPGRELRQVAQPQAKRAAWVEQEMGDVAKHRRFVDRNTGIGRKSACIAK